MKSPERTQMANEAIQAYLDIGDAVRLATLPSWVTADLTTSQVKAIFMLSHHGALAVSELARLVDVGNPAASILVQQLVEQGLAARSEDIQDRRRTLVRLTERGARLLSGQREQREAKLAQWLGQLGDEELAGLLHGLRALARIMRSEQVEEMASGEHRSGAAELDQNHS